MDIFWVRRKSGLFWGHFYPGSFLKVKVLNGHIFWVAKISNNFLVCLIFLIFVGGGGKQ